MPNTPPDPQRIAHEVALLRAKRRERPPQAEIEPPGPGQESVWDYPRPPRVEPAGAPLRIAYRNHLIAATDSALRVLETAGAPTFYVPPAAIGRARIRRTAEWTLCEYKGVHYYVDVEIGGVLIRRAGWTFPNPFTDLDPEYERLRDWYAFYPGVLSCEVDGRPARPQPGGYYGGWVTDRITGPFKGAAGSDNW